MLCLRVFLPMNSYTRGTTGSASSPSPVALPFMFALMGITWDTRIFYPGPHLARRGACLDIPGTLRAGAHAHPFADLCPTFFVHKIPFSELQCTLAVSKPPQGTPEVRMGEHISRPPSSQGARIHKVGKAPKGTQEELEGTEVDMNFSLSKRGHFLELVAFQTDHK